MSSYVNRDDLINHLRKELEVCEPGSLVYASYQAVLQDVEKMPIVEVADE